MHAAVPVPLSLRPTESSFATLFQLCFLSRNPGLLQHQYLRVAAEHSVVETGSVDLASFDVLHEDYVQFFRDGVLLLAIALAVR
jgi:hypothetical protein